MTYYQTADSDESWRQEQEARREDILDNAREWNCDMCPWYLVTVGVCEYGDEFPRCEAGRVIANK